MRVSVSAVIRSVNAHERKKRTELDNVGQTQMIRVQAKKTAVGKIPIKITSHMLLMKMHFFFTVTNAAALALGLPILLSIQCMKRTVVREKKNNVHRKYGGCHRHRSRPNYGFIF